MPIGYGGDEATKLGPLVSEKQRKRVLGYLDQGTKEGAEIVKASRATGTPTGSGVM